MRKKISNQRHISEFAELDGGELFSEGKKKKFYKEVIQTKNVCMDEKSKMIYITGEKHY